ISKSLVLAETTKPASFYDYAGPFFLLWFFPLGVWFTQPRINRLYLCPPPPQIDGEPAASAPMSTSLPYPAEILTGAAPVYAGFWLRFAAALIDGLAMFIPFCFVAFVMVFLFKLASAAKGYDATMAIALAWPVALIVLTLFYFALLESSPWQAT